MDAARRSFLAFSAGGAAGIAAAPPARTQPVPMRAFTMPFTTVVPLKSAINGVDYELYVRVPADYATSAARYPAIWTLDADYQFVIAANQVAHLADRQHIPPQVVVSIAYAGVYPDVAKYQLNRTRDYTPVFSADGGYVGVPNLSGGGPKFLEMITREAMPMIDRLFRTDPGARTFVGHSYGGLFGAWVLQDRPDLFDRYLLISPSLWYLDEWLLKREAAKQYKPLPRATRLWMATGSWENQPGHFPMVEQLGKYAALLRARGEPKLAFEHKVIADETHASIFPAAFSTGIRHLYPSDQQLAATPSDLGETCAATLPA